jgi:CheY-like chemotaxis protein
MKRILVCDDEPHIVEGLKYLLRGPDRTITTARNGRQALDQIAESVPDLLIIDVMMPVMNGLEAISRLREVPETASLPVIILTAKGQAADSTIAQEQWGAIVMAKPFQPKRLRSIVSSILENEVSATH